MKTKFVNLMVINLLILIGTGCTSSKLGDVIGGQPNPRGAITIIQSVSPAPLVLNSFVKSLVNAAEIIDTTKINAIYLEYNNQTNQLPQLGDAGEINAAAMAAITIIAGQVCGALRDKELAAASYGSDKAIFGYGSAGSYYSLTNLVSKQLNFFRFVQLLLQT